MQTSLKKLDAILFGDDYAITCIATIVAGVVVEIGIEIIVILNVQSVIMASDAATAAFAAILDIVIVSIIARDH